MKTTVNEAIEVIVKDVKEQLIDVFSPKIYVGKTNNFQRRKKEHKEEGFVYTLLISKGKPNEISMLEKGLIKKLKQIENCKILNEIEASVGNCEAEILYISLDDCHANDELGEFEESMLLGENYPLILDNSK